MCFFGIFSLVGRHVGGACKREGVGEMKSLVMEGSERSRLGTCMRSRSCTSAIASFSACLFFEYVE